MILLMILSFTANRLLLSDRVSPSCRFSQIIYCDYADYASRWWWLADYEPHTPAARYYAAAELKASLTLFRCRHYDDIAIIFYFHTLSYIELMRWADEDAIRWGPLPPTPIISDTLLSFILRLPRPLPGWCHWCYAFDALTYAGPLAGQLPDIFTVFIFITD